MKTFLLSILIFIICSCTDAKKDTAKNIAPTLNPVAPLPANNSVSLDTNWASVLVSQYINANTKYFNSLKDADTIATEWLLDNRQHTDTADYLIFEIGHTFEYHFIADRWLYIDSLTKNIYEYDLPNERLIKWAP